MRKGRHRRHQQARALKQGHWSQDEPEVLCEECRRRPHADWCMAEGDDHDGPDDGFEVSSGPVGTPDP